LENGIRTAAGDDDACTVIPPSNVQVCSREYVPLRKSPCDGVHLIVALCSDMNFHLHECRSVLTLNSIL
jgi:hypothetical protein